MWIELSQGHHKQRDVQVPVCQYGAGAQLIRQQSSDDSYSLESECANFANFRPQAPFFPQTLKNPKVTLSCLMLIVLKIILSSLRWVGGSGRDLSDLMDLDTLFLQVISQLLKVVFIENMLLLKELRRDSYPGGPMTNDQWPMITMIERRCWWLIWLHRRCRARPLIDGRQRSVF